MIETAPARALSVVPRAGDTPAPTALAQVIALRDALNAAFPQREDVVEGALCAALAGEHVCLLGPPGTGKGALVRALAHALAHALASAGDAPAQVPGAGGAVRQAYFERLLTKFSTPEELFGALDLPALKAGKYQRVLTGKLPVSTFAFVDEVFKASSSILNSLLTLMNERLFHNDGCVVQSPLCSLFGASNEMPEGGAGGELGALWDRFLLRYEVAYLRRDADLRRVMLAGAPAPAPLADGTLAAAQAQVRGVRVTDATLDALFVVRGELLAAGIVVSDRRWVKCLPLVQAKAWLEGAGTAGQPAETCPEDLAVLEAALWIEPKQRAQVAAMLGRHADPVSAQAAEMMAAARECCEKAQAKRAALAPGDKGGAMQVGAVLLGELKAQLRRLSSLNGAGRAARAVQAACDELTALHAAEAARVSAVLGLR